MAIKICDRIIKNNRKSMSSVLLPGLTRKIALSFLVIPCYSFYFFYPVWHSLIYIYLCLFILNGSLWVSKWQKGRTNTLQKTYSAPMALKGLLFHSKYILSDQSKSSQPNKFAHKLPCSSLFFPGGHQMALSCAIHNFIFQQGSGH